MKGSPLLSRSCEKRPAVTVNMQYEDSTTTLNHSRIDEPKKRKYSPRCTGITQLLLTLFFAGLLLLPSKRKTTTELGDIQQKSDNTIKILANREEKTTPTGTENWRGYQKNRTIALVHVGKAGGITIRESTSLVCTVNNKETCMNNRFSPEAVLPRQLKFPIHMAAIYPKGDDNLEITTSFLVTLRDPVQRIISTYRYSHPGNCNDEILSRKHQGPKPYACNVYENLRNQKGKYLAAHQLFADCFPSPAMEYFAQTILPPYPSSNDTNNTTTQSTCGIMSHGMVAGKGPGAPAPHMWFNYAYYMSYVIQAYPGKEVFAIRTEHEWEDLKALDLAIGGQGVFKRDGRAQSHGSDEYAPSPLSTEAYQKLCCVLTKEIRQYETILNMALNLNAAQVVESMNSVKQNCGIETSWEEWRIECGTKLRQAQSPITKATGVKIIRKKQDE